MKVLVTGSWGLVGQSLVKQLVEGGFSVCALAEGEHPHLEKQGIKIERGSVLDPESLAYSLAGVKAVFHCHHLLEWWPPSSPNAAAVNYDGTRNLLVAMSRTGVEQLVYIGSAIVFGYGTVDDPGNEERPYSAGKFRLACFDSLNRAANLLARYSKDGRVRVVSVNPTMVLGGPDPLNSFSRLLVSCATRERAGHPSGGLNLVSADAAAGAALRALGRGRAGMSYIIGGENVTYREIFAKRREAAGISPQTVPLTDRRILLKGAAGSLGAAVSGRRPALSLETARLALTGLYYDASRASEELGLTRCGVDPLIEKACYLHLDRGKSGRV